MTKPTTIEEVLYDFRRGLALSSGSPLLNMDDAVGKTVQERCITAIEQLVLERVKAQEYPDDVVLWTPDGNERTRVIKTEDAVAALKQLLGGKK